MWGHHIVIANHLKAQRFMGLVDSDVQDVGVRFIVLTVTTYELVTPLTPMYFSSCHLKNTKRIKCKMALFLFIVCLNRILYWRVETVPPFWLIDGLFYFFLFSFNCYFDLSYIKVEVEYIWSMGVYGMRVWKSRGYIPFPRLRSS